MNPSGSKPSAEDELDVTAVAKPAPGGTLAEYVEYVRSLGHPAALSPDGTQAWVPGVKAELQRFPLECNEPPDKRFIRRVLRLRGIRVVSYLVPGDASHASNCFDYVCRNAQYRLDDLSAHARRDIRRGRRNFVVRLCNWDELAEKGFRAHAETAARHGYAEPDPGWLENLVRRQRQSPFHEVWGAWKEGQLAAWMTVIKIDDWALIDIARSCTEALKWCPNNAALYEATRRLLVEEERKYVSYGLSSIQVGVRELAMHKYKTRMGYLPLPVCRVFESRGMLRPLVKSRAMSWVWEKLAGKFPGSANLRKLAGMSRIVSGREKRPLSWADED